METNILVVDDTPDNLRLLMGILVQEGYCVRPVSSGLEALSTVEEEPPDLILLDIKMLEMSGYEVCERLKADERTRDIPVIFLSALGETEDKIKAFALGGVDYVTKPFQAEEVLARVKTHLTLQQYRDHLEEVVEERTTELKTANEHLQQEIAERKRTEQELQQLKNQLHAENIYLLEFSKNFS